jgi:signal peptidase I
MSESAADIPWWRVKVSRLRQVFGVALLLLAGTFFYAMLAQGMRFFEVDSVSMLPTLHAGDRLVAMRAAEYRRGDIVIVRDPLERQGYLVKRIIGVGGDTVEVRGGGLFVNGQYVSEPYRLEPIAYPLNPYVVPKDQVFVLGDNSNLSVDSHNWAAVYRDAALVLPAALPLKSVVARAFFQYYPVGKVRRVQGYPIDALLENTSERQAARSADARALQ